MVTKDERKPDYKAMALAIFEGKDPGRVLWQPRLTFWYTANKKRGTLPSHLQDASLFDLYDYCHASIRYYKGRNLKIRYHNIVEKENWETERRKRVTWETPVGVLTEAIVYDDLGLSNRRIEYRIKSPEDFRVLEYLLRDEEWHWDQQAYLQHEEKYAPYGVLQFYNRRSPLQNLFITEMGFENTIYAMQDYPEVIRHYIDAATDADDGMYELICKCPVRFVNFGENIDAHMDPPPIWLNYLLPYYQKRTDQLKQAGKFVHIHIDGSMKPLLPYLQDCSWDGIEAATPTPQGDVTLDEIKEGLGKLVLLDGVPAIYFLSHYSEARIRECVEKIVRLFYPRLVLGVSDELPPDSDIERVRMVGEMIRDIL